MIDQGILENNFINNNASETAWKLIAFSCEFDTLAVIEEFRFDKHIFREYVIQILCNTQ